MCFCIFRKYTKLQLFVWLFFLILLKMSHPTSSWKLPGPVPRDLRVEIHSAILQYEVYLKLQLFVRWVPFKFCSKCLVQYRHEILEQGIKRPGLFPRHLRVDVHSAILQYEGYPVKKIFLCMSTILFYL